VGRLARLLSFARTTFNQAKVSDVTFDQGGGANIKGHHYSSPGDDAYPLVNVRVVVPI
jgi:hypothetical protein